MKNDREMAYVFVNQAIGYLFIDILNVFAENGKNVIIYTGSVYKGFRELDDSVQMVRLTGYNRKSTVSRAISGVVFSVEFLARMVFGPLKNIEPVFATNPPFVPFAGLLLGKLFGTKYHLIVLDVYPDILVSMNLIRQNSPIRRCWSMLNRKLYRDASNIIVIGERMAANLKNGLPAGKRPVVIGNWADISKIRPINKTENWFADKYDQVQKFTVMYSGNLGLTQDVEVLFEIAGMLQNQSKIHFMIIGDGEKKKKLRVLKNRYGLKNIDLLPLQDFETLPFSLATADLSVISLNKNVGGHSVPSKLFGILAAGSPVLALVSEDSEVADIVRKYDCGRVFDIHSLGEIANFVLRLSQNRELLEKYKENARRAASDFTPENASKYFASICKP